MNKATQQPADFVRTAFVTPATLDMRHPHPEYPADCAAEFLRLHGDSIRYFRDAECWFVWRGDRWAADERRGWIGAALKSFAEAVARQEVARHIDHPDADKKWCLADRYHDFANNVYRDDVEAVLRHRPEVVVQTEGFTGDVLWLARPDDTFRDALIAWIERLPYARLAGSPLLALDDFQAEWSAAAQVAA